VFLPYCGHKGPDLCQVFIEVILIFGYYSLKGFDHNLLTWVGPTHPDESHPCEWLCTKLFPPLKWMEISMYTWTDVSQASSGWKLKVVVLVDGCLWQQFKTVGLIGFNLNWEIHAQLGN
jgi:hypothetical protein